MKRLYIGGLGHTGSEKDLKVRFGKFGDVSDVEIITRKDENGAPLKTFRYININITDAEYKRCMYSILNKSTWKGGTLLIQLAKESFLHSMIHPNTATSRDWRLRMTSHQCPS
uniref:Nucleolar protein 8 n=1 Tax=Sinocyclocheilus anshuiensis TaxID=1608454 RepID=A0A671TA19_9TELE